MNAHHIAAAAMSHPIETQATQVEQVSKPFTTGDPAILSIHTVQATLYDKFQSQSSRTEYDAGDEYLVNNAVL
jgi:hypothetical protein